MKLIGKLWLGDIPSIRIDGVNPPVAIWLRNRIVCTQGSGELQWLSLTVHTNDNGR